MATVYFKQAAKISGKLSGHVSDWYFIGPFVIGKSEVDGDPVEFYDGIATLAEQRYINSLINNYCLGLNCLFVLLVV